MRKYILRLEKCGFPYKKARQICIDMTRNLSLFDLVCFIECMEMKNVGEV